MHVTGGLQLMLPRSWIPAVSDSEEKGGLFFFGTTNMTPRFAALAGWSISEVTAHSCCCWSKVDAAENCSTAACASFAARCAWRAVLLQSSMFAWMPRRVSRTSPVTLLLLVSISCAIWGMMKSASCTKKCEGSCAWGSADGCEGDGVTGDDGCCCCCCWNG